MNCKDFNKNLLEYIDTDCSGVINHEMKEHVEACDGCYTLYKEKLELVTSFNELFNMPIKNFTPQNSKILNKLDNKYYKKSLMRKITYHFKRNKLIYTAGITFAAMLIFTLPLMKNYVNQSYNVGKVASKEGTVTINPASVANIKSITIHDIKGKNFNGKLLEISDPKKIEIGYSYQNLKPDKTTSEIAKCYDAIAAINGGQTLLDEENKEVYAGIAIHDGKIVYGNLKDENLMQEVAGFTKDGVLVVGNHNLSEMKKLGIKEGITLPIGIPLIENGKSTTLNSDLGVNPRTAIGQKADGTVLMLVINGRSSDSIGATLSDIQKTFIDYGAVTAVNLDGGSYSTMYYNGEVINKPCSSSGERHVPSIFMVMP